MFPLQDQVAGSIGKILRKRTFGTILRRVFRGGRVYACLCGLIGVAALVCAAPASAQTQSHVLTESGEKLGILETSGLVEDLRLSVSVGGDSVESTHVWAVVGGAEKRQRNQNGYWVAWDGNKDMLIDNHFSVQDGVITFKLLDQDIGDDNRGITLMVGYKANGTLKYGYFGVLPGGDK